MKKLCAFLRRYKNSGISMLRAPFNLLWSMQLLKRKELNIKAIFIFYFQLSSNSRV